MGQCWSLKWRHLLMKLKEKQKIQLKLQINCLPNFSNFSGPLANRMEKWSCREMHSWVHKKIMFLLLLHTLIMSIKLLISHAYKKNGAMLTLPLSPRPNPSSMQLLYTLKFTYMLTSINPKIFVIFLRTCVIASFACCKKFFRLCYLIFKLFVLFYLK